MESILNVLRSLSLATLRGRLAAALTLLLLIWGGFAVVTLLQFRQLHAQTERIPQENLPRLKRANILIDLANDTARTMGEVLLLPEHTGKAVAHIQQVRSQAADEAAWFHANAESPAEHRSLEALDTLRLRYWHSQDRLFVLLPQDQVTARHYYLNTVLPLQRDYVRTIGAHLDLEEIRTSASVRASRDAYERAMFWLLLVSGGTLVLTGALSLIAWRRLTTPLNAAVVVANNIRDGDLDVTIPAPGGDEVGQLMAAMQHMLQALRADREQRQTVEQALRISESRLRQLAAHAEALQERERLALSRELHDGMGQLLTALRMELGSLRLRFGHLDPELAKQIAYAKSIIDSILPIMRNVVASLRPGPLDEGLVPAVEWLIATLLARAGLQCRLLLPTGEPELDAPVRLVAFRIVQEALTNVVRHANAAHVEITIARTDEALLRLQVEDDGVGPQQMEEGYGLQGMRERALQYGGSVTMQERAGGGTRLTVVLRLSSAEEQGGGACSRSGVGATQCQIASGDGGSCPLLRSNTDTPLSRH